MVSLTDYSFTRKFLQSQLLINDTANDFYDSLYLKFPKLLTLYSLLKFISTPNPSFCPEYEIFNLVNLKSSIINFNHDNLGKTFIQNRKILHPHGFADDAEIIQLNNLFDNYLNTIETLIKDQDFLEKLVNKELARFYIYAPEIEIELLNIPDYYKFQVLLKENNFFQYVFSIGYSFFYQNDKFNDICTYDRINEFCFNKNLPLFLISPESDELLFFANLKTQKIPLSIYWDRFTYTCYFLRKARLFNYRKPTFTDLRRFIYIYQHMDIQDVNEYKNNHSIFQSNESEIYVHYILQLLDRCKSLAV